jgi:pimeloyl-ACP methyl ester carboxylesterase
MMLQHPELRDDAKLKPAQVVARRMRMCDFFVQAGWYDQADAELDRLVKDHPDQTKRVEEARKMLATMRARDTWEETKNWYHGGRFGAIKKRLGDFAKKGVPERIQADAREMGAKIARNDELLEQATKALDEQMKAAATPQGKALASAVAVIRTELHPASVGRLEAFLGQAREAAREAARGKKSDVSTDNLLSLAVSGWLLGSASAEARPAFAINLWKTRQMVLEYMQEDGHAARQRILAEYQKTVTPVIDLDEIAQLIDNLPPFEPARLGNGGPLEVKVGPNRPPTTYHLQLPPEYTHSRAYPVLIVLNHSGEKATSMLERWRKAAADHGYILAAPDWERGLAGNYGYTVQEHDSVLDTLRDLRRRFQIDSDRVFLFGLGEGAKMAFDVGLSHPDLFAGVIPMGAGPELYARRYWRNAQLTPFYVVNGTRAGDSNNQLRDQFTSWTQRHFASLWVEYKGRGVEWLGGEVPHVFDWMRNQRRAFPLHQLGTDGAGSSMGTEFCTMRAEDNRFYWLSTNDISPRHLAPIEKWNNLVQPATLTARIDTAANEIVVKTQGLNQVSIWLGRNPKGQYMVDLERPVSVRLGLSKYYPPRRVSPSLGVLMEDLYRRGDRKHLYVARLDLNLR